jgi:RNA polymerase sigma-70 factor (ECF subfamily)
MHRADDQRIVEEVLNGHVHSFGELVERYQRPLFNLMLRMTKSRESSAELTQETFIRAYESLERFKPGRPFFPWLYSIGLNLARDYIRSNRSKNAMEGELKNDISSFSCEETQEGFNRRLDLEKVMKAMDVLPIHYRESLIMYYKEGFTMKEIADVLNISVSGAKMRVKRGLAMLRDILGVKKNERE